MWRLLYKANNILLLAWNSVLLVLVPEMLFYESHPNICPKFNIPNFINITAFEVARIRPTTLVSSHTVRLISQRNVCIYVYLHTRRLLLENITYSLYREKWWYRAIGFSLKRKQIRCIYFSSLCTTAKHFSVLFKLFEARKQIRCYARINLDDIYTRCMPNVFQTCCRLF